MESRDADGLFADEAVENDPLLFPRQDPAAAADQALEEASFYVGSARYFILKPRHSISVSRLPGLGFYEIKGLGVFQVVALG